MRTLCLYTVYSRRTEGRDVQPGELRFKGNRFTGTCFIKCYCLCFKGRFFLYNLFNWTWNNLYDQFSIKCSWRDFPRNEPLNFPDTRLRVSSCLQIGEHSEPSVRGCFVRCIM